MAQLREDSPVPCVDHSSSSNLQGDFVTLEAIACNGGGQLLVSGSASLSLSLSLYLHFAMNPISGKKEVSCEGKD